ncbi:hypothetical protein [Candidatus Berkiella aquae]|uniref:Uncharacterized protein n=1 Tax=Candidatus Berkiella aquae TaxID=295108 RepID=A0A0Q9YVH8_9GAMM|nr:hypothetical protein [Candidatus Berkiella aquae]MCS5710771.1 hypothetical protein [Candidatus Berkiella aquae]
MKLDSLQVLHLRSFNKKGEETNPLIDFKETVKPFAPMTCARHVYIFTETAGYDIDSLYNYLKEHSEKCEWFTGKEAYSFLLRWAVGAESYKLDSNDHFVLGSIRDSWNYSHIHLPSGSTLFYFMPILFKDAKNIRHLIQTSELGEKNTKEILLHMCENCADSRGLEQEPAYDELLKQNQHYIEAAQEQFINEKLKKATKTMEALNARAPEILLPSSPSPMLKFRANLGAALIKRQLQAPTEFSKGRSIEPF